MKLDAIDWPAAIRAAQEGGSVGLPALARIELESLSALFANNFPEAASRVVRARSADPLNPVHAIRLVLLLMRFGDWDTAAEFAQALAEAVPSLALPGYLWGLSTLRRDEAKRAVNIAQDVTAAHPRFALARFMRAEALLKTQFKGARKHLTDLPKGEAHAAAWADLVAKMLLGGTEDVVKVAGPLVNDANVLPAKSRPAQVAAFVAALINDSPETLEQKLEQVPADSRAEEIVLLVLHDKLQAGKPQEAAERLRKLHERLPERPAVRRLYVTLLTRLAVTEAVAERYPAALRLVEACLQLEPHETAHYQNRAALFTLMREPDSYHDAWFELNRHQYRLALLGRVAAADAIRLAKPHRLFAQQARVNTQIVGGLRTDAGVFAEMVRQRDGEKDKAFIVNQPKVDQDPELLRQWVHNHRAELVFAHLALGTDAKRFLLHPENPKVARSRIAGLSNAARSLAVLVPLEGQLLADRLVKNWSSAADRLASSYTAPPDDAEVKSLQTQYIQTFADIAVLCFDWRPDGRRPDLTEEVLELLFGVAPFFDEKTLAAAMKEGSGQAPEHLWRFVNYLDKALGIDPTRDRTLTDSERSRIANGLAVELLTTQAYRIYTANRENANGVSLALAYVERARKLDPDNLSVLVTGSEFYLAGGYLDEAEAMLARAQRSPAEKSQGLLERLDELKKALDERRKAEGKGKQREETSESGEGAVPEERVSALEAEIERFPSSIQCYEELVRLLAGAGRYPDAIEWSTLALDRCSARDAQLRARSLDLEIRGLQILGARDQNVVRLYIAGSHRPALEIMSAMPAETRSYAISYLLGQCLLAVNQPDQAREAFAAALATCDRSPPRVVLKRLAADVDQAYLQIARRVIQDKLSAAAFEEALSEAGKMLARLRRPELGFIDLARIHAGAAFARLGTTTNPMPRPLGTGGGEWERDLAAAYSVGTDRERARKLAELARKADAESAVKAEQLLRRLDTLDEQAAIADILAKSGELLRAGKLPEALAALETEAHATDPRLLRQRALILLKLERIDDADAVAAQVQGSHSPVAREFLAAYPALAFRQRVTVAAKLIRSGTDTEALAILAKAVAVTDEEKVELGYCRSFCRSMAGFRLRRQGQKAEARKLLMEALREVEQLVSAARAVNHTRLLELYNTLDSDPDLASLGGHV